MFLVLSKGGSLFGLFFISEFFTVVEYIEYSYINHSRAFPSAMARDRVSKEDAKKRKAEEMAKEDKQGIT
jgi:dephospho-CoA kinase